MGESVVISASELRDRIDQEARARLGMSGEEFIRRRRDGTLEDTLAASEIGCLAACFPDAAVRERGCGGGE